MRTILTGRVCTRVDRGVEGGARQQSIRNNGEREEEKRKSQNQEDYKTKKTKETKIKIQIIEKVTKN